MTVHAKVKTFFNGATHEPTAKTTHWTPEEIRNLLLSEAKRFPSMTAFAKRLGCNRPNLVHALKGGKEIPVAAIEFLRMKRVSAYVKVES